MWQSTPRPKDLSRKSSALRLTLHRRSTRDNLDELGCDLGLARPVEKHAKLVRHLVRVLGRVLHRSHPGRLLGRGVLEHAVEDVVGRVELGVAQESLLVTVVKDAERFVVRLGGGVDNRPLRALRRKSGSSQR